MRSEPSSTDTSSSADAPSIRAAGVVVARETATGREYAVIHRPHRADWTLPKGKLDPGETWPMAAIREVREETGLEVTLGAPLPSQRYLVGGALKEVRYWRCASVRSEFTANDEVDELRWLGAEAAGELLTYEADRALVEADQQAAAGELVPLILIRHAHAGDNAAWIAAGNQDVDRPLSERGISQIPVVTGTVLAYGANSVTTSPAERCRQTAAGISEVTTTVVGECMYDGGDIGSEDFNEVVQILIASRGPVALCTHGDQVDWLVAAAGADIPNFRKGAICVLWHQPGDLRAQVREYYDTYPNDLA